MKFKEAQQLIREASPGYLASNPPIGTVAALAEIQRKFTHVEFRKPLVRLPDEDDEKPECPTCLGEGEAWWVGDQQWGTCPHCSGKRAVPFNSNQCFIMVYRAGHSVEALVEVQVNGNCEAVVTVAGNGFKAGQKIELNEEEKTLARCAIKEAS